MQNKAIFIDGVWQAGQGAELRSENPISGEIIWAAQTADASQVDAAIVSARKAFDRWNRCGLEKRLTVLQTYRDLLETNKAEFADCIAQETGKPRWEALTEVGAMMGKLAISIQAHAERTGQRESEAPGARALLRHKPHGVVAVFGPFNFPGHLPNGHIIPALIAGNTVVFKPSELTPRVAEKMVSYLEQAGLPKGVLNLLQGGRETGMALAEHSGIDGLFFTGSAATGKAIHKQFAGNPSKILALELGGNNPLVIQDISDIEGAAYHTVQSAYITAGQRCTCARRLILVDGDDTRALLSKLIALTENISVGPHDADPQPFMGSVISNFAAEHVLQAQQKLIAAGATALVTTKRLLEQRPLLSPGLIDVTEVKNRHDDEVFGPLLQVIRVADFDAAMAEANNTRFGLAAGLFSDDANLFEEFYLRSRAGIVNYNRQLTGASSSAPFGGIGDSGNHRPSAYYATDYCAYPVASLTADNLTLPETLAPGIQL